MISSPFDQSTGARARRRAKHDAMLREELHAAAQRRQWVFLAVFMGTVIVTTLGIIGRALGVW
jgi:hypothetical protein